jgi:hypothetical protein
MLNILTIDVEDYFQVHAFSKCVQYEDWGTYECRIERNTHRLLEILAAARSTPAVDPSAGSIVEFPLSTVRMFNVNIPVAGGGYFRLFPYPMIKRGLTRINRKENRSFIFFRHPWEIDCEQPRIRGAAPRSRFRHYLNLHKTEERFKKLVQDFHFSSARQVLEGRHFQTFIADVR